MVTTTTKSANFEFIMRPLSFFRAGATRSASKIRGFLYSFSKKKEFEGGYETICNALQTSRASVWRAASEKNVGADFEFARVVGKNSRYTYVGEHTGKEFHVRTELWFYLEKFDIDGAERLLTDAEIDVLSLIYTFTKFEKKGKFEGNYGDIARMLGLDYFTVRRIVNALFSADLITRPIKAANKHGKSVYVANMKMLRYLEKKYKKAVQRESDKPSGVASFVNETVKNLDAKADRERFYEKRKEEAEKKAEKVLEKARENPRFREITGELGALEYKLARAELYAPLTLPGLEKQKVDLLAEREAILKQMGLSVGTLDVKYYCKKCSDTGYLPNGKACDCYRFKGGGT
jgi:predicted transcriptional regulator